MIDGFLMSNQKNVTIILKQKIDNIKRLPWTQTILKKTEELAFSLI